MRSEACDTCVSQKERFIAVDSRVSDKVKALVVLDSLQQFFSQCLFVSVLRKVQQVEARVRYREILLAAARGLNDQR